MVAFRDRRTALSGLIVAGMLVLCTILGVVQYRWIGEVSVAARDRLRGSLQASLMRLSLDFSSELSAACRALLLPDETDGNAALDERMAAHYRQWKQTSRRPALFRRIALIEHHNKSFTLRLLDMERGVFEKAAWPTEWESLARRLEDMSAPEPRGRRGYFGPPPEDLPMVFDLPAVSLAAPMRPGGDFGDIATVLFEINAAYLRDAWLPELVQRHLETEGSLDYQVEVLSRQRIPEVVYRSDPGAAVAARSDASIGLFDTPYEQIFRRGGPPGAGRGRGPGRGGMPSPESGRWQMFVRHRAGSLEAVVAQARWRNLAVTSGVLLLMLFSVSALVRYTRRAQRLADLQMEFVANVSHELRTPLTVIHTAAYNLRGKLAANPAQVEKYGVLIQQESGRLKDLVEQVLRFSGAAAGRVIQDPEPLAIPELLENTLGSAAAVLQQAGCKAETHFDDDLPLVMGDPLALKQAILNLLHNAAKYGAGEDGWVGVYALKSGTAAKPAVEIRIADHGTGIPPEEQAHVFEAFFRGRRAIQDQIHGTGLGLNLALKIVQAHGGSILVKSATPHGAEFVLRLPAVPPGDTE